MHLEPTRGLDCLDFYLKMNVFGPFHSFVLTLKKTIIVKFFRKIGVVSGQKTRIFVPVGIDKYY